MCMYMRVRAAVEFTPHRSERSREVNGILGARLPREKGSGCRELDGFVSNRCQKRELGPSRSPWRRTLPVAY